MGEADVRVVIVGDGATGKTLLAHSFIRSLLSPGEALPKKLRVSTMVDERCVNISLHDDDTTSSNSLVFPDADIFIVCFSVVQPSSYDNVRAKWIPQILHFNPGKPFLVVGTKLDLRSNIEIVARLRSKKHEPIDFDQGRALAIEVKASEYKECSASSLDGVREVFEDAVRVALGLHKQRRNQRGLQNNNAKKKSCELF